MVEKIEKGDSIVLRRNPTPIKSKISPFKQNVKNTLEARCQISIRVYS